jgi:hypothetical protein
MWFVAFMGNAGQDGPWPVPGTVAKYPSPLTATRQVADLQPTRQRWFARIRPNSGNLTFGFLCLESRRGRQRPLEALRLVSLEEILPLRALILTVSSDENLNS